MIDHHIEEEESKSLKQLKGAEQRSGRRNTQ